VSRPSSSISLHRRVRVVFVLAIAAALVAMVLGTVTLQTLFDARTRVIDRADPAIVASERLLASLVDQEIGVRAYVISSTESFLDPYVKGQAAQADATAELRRVAASVARAPELIQAVIEAGEHWRTTYAEPTIAAVRSGDLRPRSDAALLQGRSSFDDIRRAVRTLEQDLADAGAAARSDLSDASTRLIGTLVAASIVMVLFVGSLWLLVRRSVEQPLDSLRADAQRVAAGDVDHVVTPIGPTELHELGLAMEAMRVRIVEELRASDDARVVVEVRSQELARSNAELEQFAYVASHDLQEPLRKVASFCQLLQARYGGQLDDRADQYIGFAVDGAKRMQALINDLLSFSRVGRVATEFTEVDLGGVLDQALDNLGTAIGEAGATVQHTDLPVVGGERGLLVAVLQNLIGNAVKFRRPDGAPTIVVSSEPVADGYEVSVHDDGIGIEPEYAERVFVIFQRLHSKEQYEGTGIGLALCRKIVEYHGGRIWADPAVGQGTTIRFVLPALARGPALSTPSSLPHTTNL
jgi:signal transduction histidine kinase